MQTYYVIWRGDEDDFMVTALDLDPDHFESLDNNQIVQMCWDAEYPDQHPNPFVGEGADSYELIEIVTGTDVKFVASL